MDGGSRPIVLEGQRELVLVDLGAGRFAPQDLGEDIVAIIQRHGRYLRLRDAFSAMPERPVRPSSSLSTSFNGTPEMPRTTSQ